MVIQSAFAAWRQVFSPPLRAILWKSLALTIGLLVLIWFGLTRLFAVFLDGDFISAEYSILDAFAFFLAGAGLFIALAYLLPAVSAVVAGYFVDDAAEIVERTDFPGEPPGAAQPLGRALLYGLRFAGLSVLVNLAALTLFFIPVVNLTVFFVANAYLLGREYFELAAGRFRPMPEAARLRVEHRGTVLTAGALLAAVVLVPVVNLLTPLFGVALMVHLHKRLSRRALESSGRAAARFDWVSNGASGDTVIKAAVDRAAFNPHAVLPYGLRMTDFEHAMEDVYDFFHDVNGLLLNKGLHRLDDMLRPAAMSGFISDMVTASLAKFSRGLVENRHFNGHPDLVKRGRYPNDAVASGADGIEIKSTRKAGGAVDTHGAREQWMCVFVYHVDNSTEPASARSPMRITEIYLGKVEQRDFRANARGALGTRTATLHKHGIAKLRLDWVYKIGVPTPQAKGRATGTTALKPKKKKASTPRA